MQVVERRLRERPPLIGADHVHHRVDQSQVRERLREVAQVPAGSWVDLLGVEAERAGIAEHALAEIARLVEFVDLNQGRHEPERADQEGPVPALEAVVGLLGAVAADEPLVGQLLGDRHHGIAHALIRRRQEPQ